MKKKRKTRNNNDLQVGCLITNSFPCARGETAGGVKHLNILSGFQCVLLRIVTSFIPGVEYGISRGIEEISSTISRG